VFTGEKGSYVAGEVESQGAHVIDVACDAEPGLHLFDLRAALAAQAAVTKLRYDPPQTPGGHLPSDAWHRQDAVDNEDLAKIIAEHEKRKAGEVDATATNRLVGIGTRVRVRDCDTSETVDYEIVGAGESRPGAGRISGDSPVGSALLAHRAGEIIQVETPTGVRPLEILEIT
jgi:Transcription elongation factor, GreA/GreB, C-term